MQERLEEVQEIEQRETQNIEITTSTGLFVLRRDAKIATRLGTMQQIVGQTQMKILGSAKV